MVSNPDQWIDDMASAGVDRLTFHLESSPDCLSTAENVKNKGMKVGVALKPETPVERIIPYCHELDLVLIMTVEPGFGGQPFMEDQLDKVRFLRQKFPLLNIEVDGGINVETAGKATEAGANLIVAGSFIFHGDVKHNIEMLRTSRTSQ
mmetsp:Transcript_810/g.1181  ORF Transcript_810/g.1181 Transcript_810/m.1181 type:complete len:149 (-) Transcript_810:60-506(-)